MVFKNISSFDEEKFPQYTADYDFTLRGTKQGYKIYCNYDAIIYSHVDESIGEKRRRNFSLKNYYAYLSDSKELGNLRNFTITAFRHSPKKSFLRYLVYGIIAMIGGYLRDSVRSKLKPL